MPDAAQVKMMNTALGLLGQEPVIDLEEASLQGSIAATKLMRFIEDARDTVLRRHGFTSVLEYVVLSPVAPPAGYSNWRYPTLYYLPADALRVWEIEGVSPAAGSSLDADCWAPRWQAGTVETDLGARQVIRAQNAQDQLNAAYIARRAWAALDAHLADAVAFELAARGCYSVTADVARTSQLKKDAEAKVMMAISVGDTQEGGQPPPMPSIPAAIRNSSR